MAKIRVYELARDLNMTNKVLLQKIQDLDVAVKSHMSSLEEEAVEKIKTALLGGTKSEEIVETRIKPTIIRRRRKIVVKKAAPAPPEAEPEAPAEEPPPAVDTPPQEADMETAANLPEPQVPAEPEQVESQAPTVEAAAEPEEETVAQAAPEAPSEPTVTETAEQIAAETEQPPEAQPETPPVSEAEKPVEEPAEPEKKAVVKTLKPAKKKKKGKKDEPAKIIKLAPPTPKPKPSDEPQPTQPDMAPEAPAAEAQTDAKGAKKRKGKKGREAGADKRFFKRKISFKRKEVVEGAALYSGSKRGRKGRKGKGKQVAAQKPQITTAKAIKRRVKIDETIMLSDFAKRLGVKVNELIVKLMGMGMMATVNQSIDFDTAVLLAAEFDYEVEKATFEEETIIKAVEDDPSKLKHRPPVVTIMGHVDHGKTSLLDVIRVSSVTEGEAGGITQHIGAYYVNTDKGQIVFLDTPGHEAFTAMRSRGASVTDLVILVVAADDGVMPQTQEAINHARAAEVPIIVAINKIDKANADPERVQRELAELGLTPEDWGGDTIYVRVSAKMKEGIDELLEMILLQSEMMELKANPDKLAMGRVIEAKLDSGRGPVATVLVQQGTLHTGDPVVCGLHYGKVRSLVNDRYEPVDIAGPSIPVEILGLSGVPEAGDEFVALKDEKDAKQVSQHRTQKQRSQELAKTNRMSLDKLFEQMQDGEVKDLNLIIRADVHGSIEALRDSLLKLSNEEVSIHVIHAAPGTITETDVSLAAVSNAIIIGFNVRPSPKVQALANEEHVDMRFYNVIYNVIKDVKDAIVGMMSSTFEERVVGQAEVRDTFHIPKVGTIAGCYVTDGKIERGKRVRLLREGIIHYEGKISSLKRFKDDAKEVQSGYECGIGIENYNDIKIDDVIECYELEEVRPEVS